MRYGIDLFALAVIGGAMVFGNIRQIPARLRFWVMSAAFGVVAVYHLRLNPQGFNLAMTVLAFIFCGYYAFKALKYRAPPTNHDE